jgi:putative tryptophan/tyrosine transport system substrate-binding protein
LKRREFLTFVGGAAAAWPGVARAQQPMPVVGFLNGASAWEYASLAATFHQGLSEAGYVEGRNVLVEYRWAEGHYERMPTLAADLIRRQVAAIFANGPALQALKAATTTIPIVFATGVDPVASGLVASLNRPGGNLTGFTSMLDVVAPKGLELLHELLPTATTVALLVNPTFLSAETQSRDQQVAARILGLQFNVVSASTESQIDMAFVAFVQQRVGAIIVAGDPFLTGRHDQIIALAARHAIPAMYVRREFAAAGGLMSYGASAAYTYRQAGVYVGRVLKGEKPADLPIQQSTKFELVVNLKTAKALGLTVPLALLTRADEVIE